MQRQYRCADYTVGWVCALPVELAAAQLMLDERHPDLDRGSTRDENLYVLGTINGHNVVVGCLPAGQTGNNSAAVVATQMLATFSNIRFGLMVGIGGGVPSAHTDIRLGDVVVSQPDGTFGGVVQYDMGKSTIHGFQRTGALTPPPQVLLNALSSVQANAYLDKSELFNYASRLEGSKKFQRSRAGHDILFEATYNHEDAHSRTCVACCPDKIQAREPRQPGEEVAVHYGTIASGNQVMKNAFERDRASAQLGGVLCFEMEAAGLMNTFPCLVIRGICDYSDSHKNDKWQPYAAGIAAAYAKEVLSVVKPVELAGMQTALNDDKLYGEAQKSLANPPQPHQHTCDTATVNDTPGAPSGHVADFVDEFQSSCCRQSPPSSLHRIPVKHGLSDEQRKMIKDSLQFKQRDARLLTLKQAQTKTCRWLLKNSKYTDWIHASKIQQHRGFFWIKGKPGSGKSIMMKFLFSHAKKTMRGSIVLSFFFNARGEILEKTTTGLYRALVLQLLEKAPRTWAAFEDDDDLDARLNLIQQSGWEDEVLRQVFVRCLQKLGKKRIVCFVDALDECPEAAIRDMISLFEEIGEMDSTAEFRVCFSSRHYPEISIRTRLQLVLEEEAQHIDDITVYIDANLKIGNHPQLEDIKAELLRKASGIFLWVHLVIPELNKEYDSGRIKALKKRLALVPSGLHELFVDILTRDQCRLRHLRLCIEIILYALRPLRPGEFYVAVESSSDCNDGTFDYHHMSMSPDNLRKYVLDSSKGLAEIAGNVQWIHESVRDFFLLEDGMSKLKIREEDSQDSQDLPPVFSGHSIFVDLCLRQLRLITVNNLNFDAREQLHLQFPFLLYTLDFIFQHANESHKSNQDQKSFFEKFSPYEELWLRLKQGNNLHVYHAVHILSFLKEQGADELIQLHSDTRYRSHSKVGVYDLGQLAALYTNQGGAARALLGLPSESDGESNVQIERPNSILQKDNFRKSFYTLTFLCELGDANLLQRYLPTLYDDSEIVSVSALYIYAVSEAIVNVLAAFHLSENLSNTGTTPADHFRRVDLPQSGEHLDTTASLPYLKLLLEKYPDTRYNGLAWGGDDLLFYAASRGFNAIAELCVKDSDASCLEKTFLTAIKGQINTDGRIAIIKQLFDAGLDPHHTSDDLKDAMFEMILIPNNEDLVELVLTKIWWYLEAKNSHGLTPLLWALHHGRKTYFRIFLDAGADPMARSPDNGQPTALILSVKLADLGSFRQLLTCSECEVGARDNYGRTALMWCAVMAGGMETAVEMIEGLVEQYRVAYVNPNAEDKSGQTALMRAVESASEEAVNVLLNARDIKPDSGASNRSTPLRLSISCYAKTKHDVFLRISRALLIHGADFYCTKKLPTPAEIIARYDKNICADLRQTWEAAR